MGTPYLNPTTLFAYSSMPSAEIADLEAREPGYIAAKIAVRTSEMHSILGKRVAWPFADPVPEIVKGWLGQLVTPDLYSKRGVPRDDDTLTRADKDADLARAQMKEAADGVNGLWELPLREDLANSNGIVKGAPLSYSEQSPYTWTRNQARAGRQEDGR